MQVQVQGKIPQQQEGGVQEVQVPIVGDQQTPGIFTEMLSKTGQGFADKERMDEGAVQLAADENLINAPLYIRVLIKCLSFQRH